MKRIVLLSAAALMTAAAIPTYAQENTQNPPIIQPDGSQSGSSEKSDRANKDATGQTQGAAEQQAPADQSAKPQSDTAQQQMPADGSQSGTNQTESGQAAQGGENSAEPAAKPAEGTAGATETKPTNDTAGATPDKTEQSGVSKETTASVNITTEQKTEIRNIVVEQSKPVNVDFEVNVGVAVPQSVTLVTLPTRVVEIVPQYEGYKYFVLADGRIIIVDPNSLEVVYILVV